MGRRNWAGGMVFALMGMVFASAASGAMLAASASGVLDATTTLNGTALGADTPFAWTATFDSEADQDPDVDYGVFDAALVFDIEGYGTYTARAGYTSLILVDEGSGVYALGMTSRGDAWGVAYDTALPSSLDVNLPTPTLFSGTRTIYGGDDVAVRLLPGESDSLVLVLSSVADGAAIMAVPEPTTLALLGLGGTALLGRRRTRRAAR